MTKSIFLSFFFHILLIALTAISLPHMLRKPIDLPPVISVELIQISDITNIPYAPKAKKILEKIKKEKEKERIGVPEKTGVRTRFLQKKEISFFECCVRVRKRERGLRGVCVGGQSSAAWRCVDIYAYV